MPAGMGAGLERMGPWWIAWPPAWAGMTPNNLEAPGPAGMSEANSLTYGPGRMKPAVSARGSCGPALGVALAAWAQPPWPGWRCGGFDRAHRDGAVATLEEVYAGSFGGAGGLPLGWQEGLPDICENISGSSGTSRPVHMGEEGGRGQHDWWHVTVRGDGTQGEALAFRATLPLSQGNCQ